MIFCQIIIHPFHETKQSLKLKYSDMLKTVCASTLDDITINEDRSTNLLARRSDIKDNKTSVLVNLCDKWSPFEC